MRDTSNEYQRAFWNAPSPNEAPEWDLLWPTETRGDGNLRKNNTRTGAAQGKSSLVRKAPCKLCGFINDMTRVDHSGGSIDGEGAGGAITTATSSAPVSSPPDILGRTFTHTENAGTQAYRNAAGCALCFSKNSVDIRQDVSNYFDPWDRLRLTGF